MELLDKKRWALIQSAIAELEQIATELDGQEDDEADYVRDVIRDLNAVMDRLNDQ